MQDASDTLHHVPTFATIRTVPDSSAGVQFRDITPLLQDPEGVPGAD